MVTVVTPDRTEEVEAAGILIELPGFDASLLNAVRVAAAREMLRRSGFDLRLLPVGAVAQMERKYRRRRWWRRPK